MKLYFFGSDDCETCQLMLAILDREGILNSFEFVFVDAYANDQQEFCDQHEIDEIPHVKLVDDRDDPIFERIGIFDPSMLTEFFNGEDREILEKHLEEERDFVFDDDEDEDEEDVRNNGDSYFNIRYFRSDKEE